MRKSKMLAKFRSGGFARVCALGHVLPFFIRYAAHYRFDGIWLDLEHRAMSEREVQYLLALCHYNDIDCMVRPPTLEHTRLYRYLEDGAAGFLMPLVSDAETAQRIVQAIKFPPIGNRGMDGAGLDADYGIAAWAADSNYNADANRETFIIAQIETPEAVANVEEIASVPGIDGLFVGPADLSLRLSITKSPTMTMDSAIETVAAAAKKYGKVWSLVTGSTDDVIRYRNMGAQMIPRGGDFELIHILQRSSEEFDTVLEE